MTLDVNSLPPDHDPDGTKGLPLDVMMADEIEGAKDETTYVESTEQLAEQIWKLYFQGYGRTSIATRLSANPLFVAKVIRDRSRDCKPKTDEERQERAGKLIGVVDWLMVQVTDRIEKSGDKFSNDDAKMVIAAVDRLAKLTGADEPKKVDNTISTKAPKTLDELLAIMRAKGIPESAWNIFAERPGRPPEPPKGE